MTVAALYVETNGVYFGIRDVVPWDIRYDAKLYAGPHPVVAHPPCGPWGDLRHLSKETTRDLGPIAIAQVRAWGGVLEHPAHSKLFDATGCPRPGELPDAYGGSLFHVEQVSWGHPCRKPTRLYVVGVPMGLVVAGLRFGGEPTHQIWGSRQGGHGHRTDLKAAHASMRKRTPPAFRDFLLGLARSAKAPSHIRTQNAPETSRA